MKQKLFPDEKEILTTVDNGIFLTNYRIQKFSKSWERSYSLGIFLENISSIEVTHKSNKTILWLAYLSLPIAYYFNRMDLINGLASSIEKTLVPFVVLLIVWLSTRKHVVSIASNGGAILELLIIGTNKNKIEDLVYDIFLAQQNRINQLHKITQVSINL